MLTDEYPLNPNWREDTQRAIDALANDRGVSPPPRPVVTPWLASVLENGIPKDSAAYGCWRTDPLAQAVADFNRDVKEGKVGQMLAEELSRWP
jgi:hypothetical protein